MRPPGLDDQRGLLSRGPSGLPRSGKSGKNGHQSVCSTDSAVEYCGDRLFVLFVAGIDSIDSGVIDSDLGHHR